MNKAYISLCETRITRRHHVSVCDTWTQVSTVITNQFFPVRWSGVLMRRLRHIFPSRSKLIQQDRSVFPAGLKGHHIINISLTVVHLRSDEILATRSDPPGKPPNELTPTSSSLQWRKPWRRRASAPLRVFASAALAPVNCAFSRCISSKRSYVTKTRLGFQRFPPIRY
jgi:hypothetical protein